MIAVVITPEGCATIIARDGQSLSFTRDEAIEVARALFPLFYEHHCNEAGIEAQLREMVRNEAA